MAMPNAEEIRRALQCSNSACACHTGPNAHCACSGHDDRVPSLTVHQSGDTVLVNRKGGCTVEALLQSAATSDQPLPLAVVAAAGMSPFVAADVLGDESGESGVEWLPVLGQEGFIGRGLFTLISARPMPPSAPCSPTCRGREPPGPRRTWCSRTGRGGPTAPSG